MMAAEMSLAVAQIRQLLEQERPQSDWYQAAYTLYGLLCQLWEEKRGQKHSRSAETQCEEIQQMLTDCCRRNHRGINEALVTGLFEHLFQNKELATFFQSWKEDPVLGPLYAESMALATGNIYPNPPMRQKFKRRKQ